MTVSSDEYKEMLAFKADLGQVGGNHYREMAIEPWAVMQACLSPEEFRGFLRGSVIKYALRAAQAKKPGWEEDGEKGKHYMAKLSELR